MKRKLFLLVIVLLAAMLLPARWAAAEPTATSFIPGEPNDTFATANEAYVGYLMTPADVDFLRVELNSPYRMQPHVYGSYFSPPAVLRVELALYDSGQILLAQDTNCDEAMELPDQYLPAGLYYLRLRACPGAFDGDQLYNAEIFGYSFPIEWEPNNNRATANPFAGIEAAIQPAGDVDFYHFEGKAGEHWYAHLSTYDAGLNPEMALLNAGGTVLATSGPDYLHYDLTADGTYYFRVRSTSGGAGEYSLYGGGSQPDDCPVTDTEPNDTPAQAVETQYGCRIRGMVSETDPMDYVTFHGVAGQVAGLPDTSPYHRFHEYGLALYGPAMNPLPLQGQSMWAELPATGLYTIAISFDPDEGWETEYDIAFMQFTGDEPNDTFETATPILFGQQITNVPDFDCDLDIYIFQGRAGDVFNKTYPVGDQDYLSLFAADGTPLHNLQVLPVDGTYYVALPNEYWDDWDGSSSCNYGEDTWQLGEALWVSAAVDGLGGNAAIKAGDIVTRKTAANQWQIVFDASDVGIIKNVVAFERMPNGSILMSLAAAQNVPGLGKVMPHDIIQFLPIALGDTTAGTFQWFLDGSDVGLTTTGEKIDAITMFREIENPLRISTSGGGSAPKNSGGTLNWSDEDIVNFVGTAYGANSAGKWRMHLNGSDVRGLAAEDVNAATRVELYPQHHSYLLLSMATNFVVDGQTGTPFDVLNGDEWLTAVQRLTDQKIDGLSIGPAWTP